VIDSEDDAEAVELSVTVGEGVVDTVELSAPRDKDTVCIITLDETVRVEVELGVTLGLVELVRT
jgi:hypothetical protein